MIRQHHFSLIELLIVVGILGALSALILPVFNNTSDETKHTVARTKMNDIRRAFARFHADLFSELAKKETDTVTSEKLNLYLKDMALYGLWPLFVKNHPVLTEAEAWSGGFKKYPLFDPETQFGWRGPYLEYDGIVQIASPVLQYAFSGSGNTLAVTSAGGQSAGEACKIPVLRDPYGGYFRILCPEQRTQEGNALSLADRLKRLVLVCTGPNRKLETATNSFIPADDGSYIKSITADDLTAGGDDIVMRLLPQVY